MDMKNFNLGTDSMGRYKYILIMLNKTSDKFHIKYNLDKYAHNGYMLVDFRKGIYRLLQAWHITHNRFVKTIELFGYAHVPVTSSLL